MYLKCFCTRYWLKLRLQMFYETLDLCKDKYNVQFWSLFGCAAMLQIMNRVPIFYPHEKTQVYFLLAPVSLVKLQT